MRLAANVEVQQGSIERSPSLKPEDLSNGIAELNRIAKEQEFLNRIMSNNNNFNQANF